MAQFLRGLRSLMRCPPRHRLPSLVRRFNSSTFPVVDGSTLFEEEAMPCWEMGLFYPVRIGEVFKDRYQVLRKMGYGANSTVWMCRDFILRQHVAVKVHVHYRVKFREIEVLRHLASLKSKHPGKHHVRGMQDSFDITGPLGEHHCIVYEPLLCTIMELRDLLPSKRMSDQMLKLILTEVLQAVDYLHTVAGVIHTDIQANNLLLRTSDSSIFRQQWEEEELLESSPRKTTASGHIIYQSHSFRPSVSIQDSARSLAGLVLSDLGEARIGLQQKGLAQPDLYRAPEILLGMHWGPQIDTWSIAVMIWDFFFKTHMFRNEGPDGKPSLAHHLAEMVALLSPPPLKFLQRSGKSLEFWDEQGVWRGLVPIPTEYNLDVAECFVKEEAGPSFVRFLRKSLKWVPEDRLSARELLQDEWLLSPD